MTGTRRLGGWFKRYACTGTKALGRLTPGTGISVDSNSLRARIAAFTGEPTAELTSTLRASSYTGPGSSTGVTATHGVSGELRKHAACGNPKTDAVWIDGVNRLATIWEDAAARYAHDLRSEGAARARTERWLAAAWERANRKALG